MEEDNIKQRKLTVNIMLKYTRGKSDFSMIRVGSHVIWCHLLSIRAKRLILFD